MHYFKQFLAFNESVQELSSDACKHFLAYVKKHTPDLVHDARNKIANRGFAAAKEWYNYKDPIVVKSEERAEKFRITIANKKQRKLQISEFIPSWKTVSDLVNDVLLTPEVKQTFFNHCMPQLVLTSAIKKSSIKDNSFHLIYRIKTDKLWNLSDFGIQETGDYKQVCKDIIQAIKKKNGIIANINSADISSDEKKLRNIEKTRKAFKKAGLDDEDQMMFHDKDVKTINVLSVRIRAAKIFDENKFATMSITSDTYVEYRGITSEHYKEIIKATTLKNNENSDLKNKIITMLHDNLQEVAKEIISRYKVDIAEDITFKNAEDFFS